MIPTPVSEKLKMVLRSQTARRQLRAAIQNRGGIINIGKKRFRVRFSSAYIQEKTNQVYSYSICPGIDTSL